VPAIIGADYGQNIKANYGQKPLMNENQYRIFIEGSVVPFVRVGPERYTRRARRYRNCKHAMAETAAASLMLQRHKPTQQERDGLWQVSLMFWRYRKTGDLDNLMKTVLDAMQGILWTDDKQVKALDGIVYQTPKDEDATAIYAQTMPEVPPGDVVKLTWEKAVSIKALSREQ